MAAPGINPESNDNQAAEAAYGASRAALLAPVAANGLLWAALAALAYWARGGHSQVFSLGLTVFAVSSAVLAMHALVRLRSVAVTPMRAGLMVRNGFSPDANAMLPWGLVRHVMMRRGIGGRLTGSGTLVVQLSTGQRLAIADLAEPDAVLTAVQAGWQREETEVLEALGVKKKRTVSDSGAVPGKIRRTG